MASGVESGKSRLIEAKAVRGRFPFYGTIQVATRDSKGGNEFFASTLADDKAIVAPELFEALGVSFGDSIRIGGAQYEVAGIVEEEPGRFDFALTAGPRVFLTLGGLERADLDDFVACYNPKNRHARKESERFKSFTYEELIKRDKLNLDIFWLKDEALEDSANLPAPDIIALEITEDLRAALEQFEALTEDLNGTKQEVEK